MSTLHTVNKSPFAAPSLLSCINHCKAGDAVLMIEDGVYGALAGSGVSDQVRARLGEVSLYAIKADLEARGLDASRLIGEVQVVEYDGFVDLVTRHDRTQAWL